MIETAEVYLWGTRVGYVHQGAGDAAASFEYDKDFQTSGIELSPFRMPLSDRVYSFPERTSEASAVISVTSISSFAKSGLIEGKYSRAPIPRFPV